MGVIMQGVGVSKIKISYPAVVQVGYLTTQLSSVSSNSVSVGTTYGGNSTMIGDLMVLISITATAAQSIYDTGVGLRERLDQQTTPNLNIQTGSLTTIPKTLTAGPVRDAFAVQQTVTMQIADILFRNCAFDAIGDLSAGVAHNQALTVPAVTSTSDNCSLYLILVSRWFFDGVANNPSQLSSGWELILQTRGTSIHQISVYRRLTPLDAAGSSGTVTVGPCTTTDTSYFGVLMTLRAPLAQLQIVNIALQNPNKGPVTGTGLTTTTAHAKFNSGSIVLPYNGTTPQLQLWNVTLNGAITVELWRKTTTTPGSFDIVLELNADANNYLMVEDDGTVRAKLNGTGVSTGSSGVTDTLNTWVHWVIVVDLLNRKFTVARGGNRIATVGVQDVSSFGSWSQAFTNIRFKDTLYGGEANGYMDDLRVSFGDIYNLLTSATYTVPTNALGVPLGTASLFTVDY